MSNHPIFLDVDTLTSQTVFIFSLFVDNVEMVNPWKFQPYFPMVPMLLRFEKLTKMGVLGQNLPFWFYIFCYNYCSSHPFILKFGMGEFIGIRNPKITLRRLKNKPVLRYLRFQVLGAWDQTGAEKYT